MIHHFEEQLINTPGSYSTADYLKRHVSDMLDSPNIEIQEKGVSLMKLLLSEFSEETYAVSGQEELGDYFLKQKNFEEAEIHYRIVTQNYHSSTRNGTSGIADLKLAEAILRSNQEEKFQEAYEIATSKFVETEGVLPFNDQKFYYNKLMANLCDRMGRMEEASHYASTALELSMITQPQFVRYKSLGRIITDPETLEKLNKIMQKL